MKTGKNIHTILDQKTYNYLKRIQDERGVDLKTSIRIVVESNELCKKKLEKRILKEVVDHVIDLYVNGQYFSKN